jgi:hypothetical protein
MASPLVANPVAHVVELSSLPAGQAKSQLIKSQVEAALAKKVPSALTVRERPTPLCLPTGVAEVDALCGGGIIPRGALTEITGPASSGRTSLLLSLFAQVTGRAEFCALVDAGGSFDPASAEAAGVDLDRVLWVKCSAAVPAAVAAASRRRSVGKDAHATAGKMPALLPLERCLRVADLLLMSGGFGLVALDLGDVSPDAARRVPLTTWFRFRRAVEGTPAALVVLEQEAHAKSCAAVVLELQTADFSLQSSADFSPTHARIFTGVNIEAALIRGHAQKKFASAARPAHFQAKAVWAS